MRPALALVLVLHAGCDEITLIELGRCGNRVLEPDRERCEPSLADAGVGEVCGEVDSVHECQWVCNELGAQCPEGYGCSVTGRCNEVGTGYLAFSPGVLPDGVLELADASGDGFADVVHWDGPTSSLTVYASVPGGEPAGPILVEPQFFLLGSQRLPAGMGRPTFVQGSGLAVEPNLGVDEPNFTMLAPFLEQALVIFHSTSMGPVPTPQTIETTSAPNGLLMDALRPRPEPFGCPFTLRATGTSLIFELDVDICPGGEGAEAVTDEIAYAGDTDRVALLTDDLLGDGAEEAAVWLQDTGQLLLVRAAADPFVVEVMSETAAPVTSGGACGFLSARVDGDQEPDLLLCADGTIYAAHASAGFADLAPLAALAGLEALLAAGDLNGDGRDDFVSPDGVFLAPDLTPRAMHGDEEDPWQAAAIGDFNRDGIGDLAATTGSTFLDVLLGTPEGWFNTNRLPTTGLVTRLAIGDYDGDRSDDIAFANRTAAKSGASTIEVVFGDASAPPSQVVSMGGPVFDVAAMAASHVAPTEPDEDLTSELLVVETPPQGTPGLPADQVSHSTLIFIGSATRILLAPHFFAATLVIGGPMKLGRIEVGAFRPTGGAGPTVLTEVVDPNAQGLRLIRAEANEAFRLAEETADEPNVFEFDPAGDLGFDPADLRLAAADRDGDTYDELAVAGPDFVAELRFVDEGGSVVLRPTVRSMPGLGAPVALAALPLDAEDQEDFLFLVTSEAVYLFPPGPIDQVEPISYPIEGGPVAAARIFLPSARAAPQLAAVVRTPGAYELRLYPFSPVFAADPAAHHVAATGGGAGDPPLFHIAEGDVTGDGLADLLVSTDAERPSLLVSLPANLVDSQLMGE